DLRRASAATHGAPRRARRRRRSRDRGASSRTDDERTAAAGTRRPGPPNPQAGDAMTANIIRQRRTPERGSISPMVLYGTIIVCVMGVGGATVGRLVPGPG